MQSPYMQSNSCVVEGDLIYELMTAMHNVILSSALQWQVNFMSALTFSLFFFLILFYASAFRRWRHYVFGLSVCPSVHPKPEIPSFHLYMGPLVHPTNRDRFAACPSIHLERFPGICRRTHGANGLKFCMLMYLDHLQNWLDYGYSLLIFAILALFWLSETGQIWCFQAFSGEHMEGMAWNCVCWCILITFITDYSWSWSVDFFKFWRYFDLVKRVKFGGSRPFGHVDFPHYGTPLTETDHIWDFWALSGQCVGVNVEGGAEAYFWRFALSSV